jgi:hypothetical protein
VGGEREIALERDLLVRLRLPGKSLSRRNGSAGTEQPDRAMVCAMVFLGVNR